MSPLSDPALHINPDGPRRFSGSAADLLVLVPLLRGKQRAGDEQKADTNALVVNANAVLAFSRSSAENAGGSLGRFSGGDSGRDAARTYGLVTVENDWRLARAWLAGQLGGWDG
jgi:hypothetical protein